MSASGADRITTLPGREFIKTLHITGFFIDFAYPGKPHGLRRGGVNEDIFQSAGGISKMSTEVDLKS